MKYLFAGLVISSVQIVFMLAFTLFALGIGVITLTGKLKPQKISEQPRSRLPGSVRKGR